MTVSFFHTRADHRNRRDVLEHAVAQANAQCKNETITKHIGKKRQEQSESRNSKKSRVVGS